MTTVKYNGKSNIKLVNRELSWQQEVKSGFTRVILKEIV